MNQHLGDDALPFLRGELDESQRKRIQAHLERCAACRGELRHIRIADSALANWPQNPQLPTQLLDTIRAPAAPHAPSRAWRRRLSHVAALGLLIVMSGALGYRMGATRQAPAAISADSLPSFLLLLEEPRWPPASVNVNTRSGYGDWATAIRRTGQFVGGEKLTDEPGWRVRSDGTVARPEQSDRPPNVSGWFLVRARDYNAAIDWVRRGPHLRYGTVLVRQVE